MHRNMVDLPDPDGPATTIAFPRSIARSTPSSTTLPSKLLRMPSSATRCEAPRTTEPPDPSPERSAVSLLIAQPPGPGGPGRSDPPCPGPTIARFLHGVGGSGRRRLARRPDPAGSI